MLRRVAAVLFAVMALAIGLSVRADRADRRKPTEGPEVRRAHDIFERREVALLCAEELRDVCEGTFSYLGFDVQIEPAGTTADRLADGGGLHADAWLTFRPFEQLASSATADPGLMGAALPVLARSPVVLVGPRAAVEALDSACPDEARRFACAVTLRPETVALRDPRISAIGVLSVASVAYAAGLPDDAERIVDAAELERLRTLATGSRRSQAPYEDAMRMNREIVALTLEAEVIAAVRRLDFERQDAFDGAAVRYPMEVRAAEVVMVPAMSFSRTDDLADLLRSDDVAHDFTRAGYQVEGKQLTVVDFVPAFRDRPTVRTDIGYPAELVRDLRLTLA